MMLKKVRFSTADLFDFDHFALREEEKVKLDKLVKELKDINYETILAISHADRIGAIKYNQKLSERRADSICSYLVSNDVPVNRIRAEGRGKTEPVTKPDECKEKICKKLIACLQPNRRVEVEVEVTKEVIVQPQ